MRRTSISIREKREALDKIVGSSTAVSIEDLKRWKSEFKLEVGIYICAQIAMGRPLDSICADVGMPKRVTVLSWIGTNPTFQKMYQEARASQMEIWADDIIQIADDPSGDINRDKIRIETRKWLMKNLNPRFAESTTTKHADANGNTLKIENVIQVILPDNGRHINTKALSVQPNEQTIEVKSLTRLEE